MTDFSRPLPSAEAGERVSLTGFLDYQRETLAMKCAGLTDEQLRATPISPSRLSLLGLVRHLAAVERSWFEVVMAGTEAPPVWQPRPDGGFSEFDVDDADPRIAFETWRRECARSREVVAAVDSLDVCGHYRQQRFSLRYVLTHMIEEYARHNG
ncbi:MAG: DinB family protein, partial [Stackebrandtia sp.]